MNLPNGRTTFQIAGANVQFNTPEHNIVFSILMGASIQMFEAYSNSSYFRIDFTI